MDHSLTLAEYLQKNPGGTLEEIAAQYQTTLLEVELPIEYHLVR